MAIEEHLAKHGCFCYTAMKTGGYTRAAYDNELNNLKKVHYVQHVSHVCANGSGVKIQFITPPKRGQIKAYKGLIDRKVTTRTHGELDNVTTVERNWLHQGVMI